MEQTDSQLFVEQQRRDHIIQGAVTTRLRASLSRYGITGWLSYKTRIVDADEEQRVLVIETPVDEQTGQTVAIPPGEHIGISFRRGRAKCSFTTVVSAAGACEQSSTCQRGVIGVDWPDKLQIVQRRVYNRVAPPAGTCVQVYFWPEGEGPSCDAAADVSFNPGRHDASVGRMEDLSAGGVRVISSQRIQPSDRTYVCAFCPRNTDRPLQFEAKLRHIDTLAGEKFALGFQFVGLDATTQGQCRLAHLANVVSGFRQSRARARVRRRHPCERPA